MIKINVNNVLIAAKNVSFFYIMEKLLKTVSNVKMMKAMMQSFYLLFNLIIKIKNKEYVLRIALKELKRLKIKTFAVLMVVKSVRIMMMIKIKLGSVQNVWKTLNYKI